MPTSLFPNIKIFFYYAIGVLALIALADYQPQLAVLFVVILIVGVLLNHWSDYVGLLTPPTSGTARVNPQLKG